MLLVVTKNVTTDSAWPISSNPDAHYNAPARRDCNLRIPLWQLVRASTAAPAFFPPEILQWDRDDPSKTFVFADGGVTPHNNPAFLLYRMATEPAYWLGWATGEDRLLLVSIGTARPSTSGRRRTPRMPTFSRSSRRARVTSCTGYR
jgi:predicted acylesterase/phospholipase RssA